jgi:hypothetical protein
MEPGQLEFATEGSVFRLSLLTSLVEEDFGVATLTVDSVRLL